MAANTSPIFLLRPRASWVSTGVNANTALDGTGTVATIFTADATNGSKIEEVYLEHLGTNVATVVRFFINNGSTNATASNNTLIHEETMAANTLSQTARAVDIVWRANLVLPAGYKLNVTIGTAIAAGIQVTGVGGDY
jgi:hypothetical protein